MARGVQTCPLCPRRCPPRSRGARRWDGTRRAKRRPARRRRHRPPARRAVGRTRSHSTPRPPRLRPPFAQHNHPAPCYARHSHSRPARSDRKRCQAWRSLSLAIRAWRGPFPLPFLRPTPRHSRRRRRRPTPPSVCRKRPSPSPRPSPLRSPRSTASGPRPSKTSASRKRFATLQRTLPLPSPRRPRPRPGDFTVSRPDLALTPMSERSAVCERSNKHVWYGGSGSAGANMVIPALSMITRPTTNSALKHCRRPWSASFYLQLPLRARA